MAKPEIAKRRVRRARCGRLRAWFLLAAPTATVVIVDAARRGTRILAFDPRHRATYLAAIAESLLVWGTLLYASSRRRGLSRHVLATLLVLVFTLSLGGQRYFHDRYNAYVNIDVSWFASDFKESIVNQLFADLPNYTAAMMVPFLTSVLAIVAARRYVLPRRRSALIAAALSPLLLIGSWFVPAQHAREQASTPDALYLEAIGGLIRVRLGLLPRLRKVNPRLRASLPVVLDTPRKPNIRPPNVLFVILESVRADAVCADPAAPCLSTPHTNALVPDRFPLTQMRSLDSSTPISLAILWAGVGSTESREVMHTWPLLFDYARAAGYSTAYFTSQNMMFGTSRLWVQNLGVSEFVSATDLDPAADIDTGASERLLADYVTRHLGDLHEPFFAVVQLSNTHTPYAVDPKGPMPFTPWNKTQSMAHETEFHNYYLNAVFQEDAHVATILRRVKESPLANDTAIVYTSDHGEAFREHLQTEHTLSVFDEEIHVPAWIDVPPGVLTDAQASHLSAARAAYTFHVDLPATILDLMGVWDDPGIARYRAKMVGVSLLRGTNANALPLTNCNALYSCAFDNWGYMQGSLKIEGHPWDRGFHCFDVASDPLERKPLGDDRCRRLEAITLQTFHQIPGFMKN